MTIEKAILIATEAHAGQLDKGGMPYILHPLRIMGSVQSLDTKIIAVLHDVVEDTSVTLKDLEDAGFGCEIIYSIDCLTRKTGQSYDEYLQCVMLDAWAVEVKRADLKDNMDWTRLPEVTYKDMRRIEKYMKACKVLDGLVGHYEPGAF